MWYGLIYHVTRKNQVNTIYAVPGFLIDAEKVLQVIESFDGALPFNDKANPEVIKRELQMSKNEFKKAGADIITVHAEACHKLGETLDKIREVGCKVGVSINPHTNISAIEHVLDKVDMVLIMTVQPGFGGQKYMDIVTPKIAKMKKMIDEKGLNIDIEVDGGISADNVRTVLDAGANVIVAGSAVYKNDVTANVKEFLEIFKEYEGA